MKRFVGAVLVALVLGCRTTPPDDERVTTSNVSSTVDILAPEIERAGLQAQTALEVVQKLRPGFLANSVGAGRRIGLSVTVNGGPMDDVGALARVNATAIEAIRYYTATQAGMRFGFRASGPVIQVTLKPDAKP